MEEGKGQQPEKVEHNPIDYRAEFRRLASEFLLEFGFESLTAITQNQWNGFLFYVHDNIFFDRKTLMLKNDKQHRYNPWLLESIVDLYISYCALYDKEVSITGFAYLTGIDREVIQLWGSNTSKYNTDTSVYINPDTGIEESLTIPRINIFKKLNAGREESLSAKLATGNKNPVGILAILNRHFSWSLPGVSKELNIKQDQQTAVQIADKYASNCAGIPDNSAPTAPKQP